MPADLAFEVKDDSFGVGFVEGLLVLGGAEEERIAVEVVGFAGGGRRRR